MLGNIAAVFSKEGVWSNMVALLVAWAAPMSELAFLLYGLVIADWILDVYVYFKSTKEKHELWKTVTRPMIEKLLLYSLFAITAHSLQVHFFKDMFSLYKWSMFIPISAEFLSITKTVEARTGIKIVTKLQELLDFAIGISRGKEDEK